MGDGFMASFGSVTKAMDCAIALQRAFAAHNESMPEPLHVRVGLNAGEPIEEDGDLFGSTVILASRIAAKAGAGEILIPEPLRHLLSGKSYVYADRGETMLKGFEDAVRLYEVRLAGLTSSRTTQLCNARLVVWILTVFRTPHTLVSNDGRRNERMGIFSPESGR